MSTLHYPAVRAEIGDKLEGLRWMWNDDPSELLSQMFL
jgi:hypothetical protein